MTENALQSLRRDMTTMSEQQKELLTEIKLLSQQMTRLTVQQEQLMNQRHEQNATLGEHDERINVLERLTDKQSGAMSVMRWLLGAVGTSFALIVGYILDKI